jgi:biopolymer transport protein ExbD
MHGIRVDRVVARHIRKMPGARREDAIKICVMRDGASCFGYSRVKGNDLPDKIRDAVRNGAEKRIYLEVDARARYSDVSAVLSQIQGAGIQNLSTLAEPPGPTAWPSPRPTP